MPEYDEQEKAEQKIRRNRNTFQVFEEGREYSKIKRNNPPEMATGIRSIDNHIWGIERKKLYVIAARPAQGKSSFLTQLAWNIAKQDKRVLYLSMEMSAMAIAQRIVSNEFGVEENDPKFEMAEEKMPSKLLEHPFLDIVEIGGRTIAELQEIYRLYKPDVLIVDYIQQVLQGKFRSKHEAIANYICDCKELSIAYNTAIVLASQVNRAGSDADENSVIDFMKGAGEIEEAADALFHLKWIGREDENEPMNKYKVVMAKNRFGPRAKFDLEFDPALCRFKDWDYRKETTERQEAYL